MLRSFTIILTLLVITAIQAQNENVLFNKSKLIKIKDIVNGKETEILKYRFFNNKIVSIDLNNKNWTAEVSTLHNNGTVEKNEKVWLDANNNVVSSFKQYYTSHNNNSKDYHGNIYNSFSYENGIKSGVEKFYYANGQIKKSGVINKNGRQGEWKTYHLNGNLKSIESWRNFKREGEVICYFENGNISSKGQYKNGKPFGKWDFFNHDKKEELIKSQVYCENNYESIRLQ